MKVSYASEELIEEVLEDIALFGEEDEVFAIYSYFEVVDGRKIDAEFITDYFSATEPVILEKERNGTKVFKRYYLIASDYYVNRGPSLGCRR